MMISHPANRAHYARIAVKGMMITRIHTWHKADIPSCTARAFALAARAQQSAVMQASACRKTRRTGQEIAVERALACANYA